jgi:hypothetical protein
MPTQHPIGHVFEGIESFGNFLPEYLDRLRLYRLGQGIGG